jgi:hypothetical protein
MVSFHILIASIGRPTLQRMLNSLMAQLSEDDKITIVFDGFTEIPKFDFSVAKCKIRQFSEPEKLGFWGHGIRNKYASLLDSSDFVMHADDDDSYMPEVFSELRNLCINTQTLYIAKMRLANKHIVPEGNFIKLNHIGTPCGIIPYELNKTTLWKHRYGGDGLFYEELATKCKSVDYLPTVIYSVRS